MDMTPVMPEDGSTGCLMGLPVEIRLQIWETFYTQIAPPQVRYADDGGSCIETSSEVDVGPLFTCKAIYAEAYPIFISKLRLHMVYQSHAPCQLCIPPPKSLRNVIREICFHCPEGSHFSEARPPKRPVKFHEFPSLRTFRFVKKVGVNVRRLSSATVLGETVTPAYYDALPESSRLAFWQSSGLLSQEAILEYMTRFGSGGWMSRLIDPQAFPEPVSLEPDVDPDCENDDWKMWSQDDDWASEDSYTFNKGLVVTDEVSSPDDTLSRFRRVISQMRTLVEAEVHAFWDVNDASRDRFFAIGETNHIVHVGDMTVTNIDRLLVVIDAATRRIVDMKRLTENDIRDRDEWGREAT